MVNAEVRIAGLAARWHVLVPDRLGLWLPARADDALDRMTEAEYEASDERLPYFASLWPAGEALARHVLDAASALDGRLVLDLGCGVGAIGLAAALGGARVAFLDWEPRSMAFVSASCDRLHVTPAALLTADWRRTESLGSFERILAADVLYEARNVRPVAEFLATHLTPDGEAWIADPRRPHAERLPQALEVAGLRLLSKESLPYRPQGVRVHLYRVAPGGDDV